MKRRPMIMALIMCAMLTAALLPSCSGGSSGQDSSPAAGAPETEVVRLALFPHGHILNAIAEKNGYLADEGITVEYVPVNTDEEVFRGIANGTIDVASNSGTNLPLEQISQGMDLTIFGGYLLTGCMPVIARVDKEWNGIEDLIGSKVAFEPNLFAITGPLLDMGYDPVNDIDWIVTSTQEERIEAVKNGDADYALVGTQLNYAVNSDPEVKILTYASDVLPDYSCCRVEALTSWVTENPNTVRALLRAWIRALEYYETHTDEVISLIAEISGSDEATIAAYLNNPHCDLNVDPMKSSVERAWDYMDRLGLLSAQAKEIDIDDHIDVSLYKDALDECQRRYGSEDQAFYEKMQAQYARNNM